jgi:integrase
MSVRLRKWKDKQGKAKEAWVVDVVFEHPSGRLQRVKKASPVNTRRGAEQFERTIRQSMLEGTFGKEAHEAPTLKRFSERFLKHAITNNKPSSVKTKQDILRKHLIPTFGHRRLDDIGPEQIEGFKSSCLAEGLHPKSVNNYLTVLRKLLSLGVDFALIKEVPPIKWLRAPPPAIDFLTFEEAADFTAKLPDGRWRTMIVLALNTGLRIGELCALGWDCVDLTTGRLIVRRNVFRGQLGTPKGGRPREVPLNETAREALRRWPRQLKSPWVFPQKGGGFVRNPQHACTEAIARLSEAVGPRRISWHTLRHTFASHLVMRGVSLRAVQELLGHSTIDMTMRYAHLSPDVSRAAVLALDARPHGTYTEHAGS